MSWRDTGLQIQQEEHFAENYRNTKAIAQLALGISEMDYFNDVPDLVAPREPVADGPAPTLVECDSIQHEVEISVGIAEENLARNRTVAVLFRRRHQENKFRAKLDAPSTRLRRDLSYFPAGPTIFTGTFHAAKGMEFDTVVLPHCSEGVFPETSEIETFGADEAMANDGPTSLRRHHQSPFRTALHLQRTPIAATPTRHRAHRTG